MSYDVWIGKESFNYTSNCPALWYDHISDTGKGGGLREIEGLTGAQAAIVLADAFARMNDTRQKLWAADTVGEPAMSKRYDSANGWGSMVGAILFMGQIIAACLRNPRKRLGLSA